MKKRVYLPSVKARTYGFTLLELMIVLVIIAAVAGAEAKRRTQQNNNELAKAMAEHIAVVGESLKTYVSNQTAVLGAVPTKTVALADLKAASACSGAPCLTSSFVEATSWSTGYDIQVQRIGSAPYQFEGLICTKNAIQFGGKTRLDLVGAAVSKLGIAGGMTYDAAGAYGRNGTWNRPSSDFAFANSAGKLCYLVSQSLVALDQMYLRVDGLNQMKATLRMNNNAIDGATTINASGDITSSGTVQGATLTSQGNVNVGDNGFLQSAGKLNIQAAGDLSLQPGSPGSTIVGGSGGSGNLQISNDVTVGRNATVSNEVVATSDVRITSMTSRPSAPGTTSLKALAPNLVEVDSVIVTAHGQSIPVPTCPAGGQPRVFVIPQTVRGQVLAGNWGSDIRAGGPAGGPWTVIALDNQNQPMPNATAPTFQGLARIFCAF